MTEIKKNNCYKVRLFIAGKSSNSRLARKNLDLLLKKKSDCDFEIEVIDVLKDPSTAVQEGIFITPALQVFSTHDNSLIFGNLNDVDKLLNLFP